MRGHTLERLQTRTMQTGDLDSSFDDRSRDVATGEPQLGPPQIRGVSPMESTAELPVQAILDSSALKDPVSFTGTTATVLSPRSLLPQASVVTASGLRAQLFSTTTKTED